jgi:hypothetical protein
VRANIQHRNEAMGAHMRPRLRSTSSNGLHYSWDWGQLHLVQLNLYPGGR